MIGVSSLPREVCLASGMDHHIPKPLRLEALQAECEALGLVPRPGAATDPTLAASRSSLPLPRDRPGVSVTRTAEDARAFAHDVLPLLPTLWRAANAGDLNVLERGATELQQRAARPTSRRIWSRSSAKRCG